MNEIILGSLVKIVAGYYLGCAGVVREVLTDKEGKPAAYYVEMCCLKDGEERRPVRWRKADTGEVIKRGLEEPSCGKLEAVW